MPIVGQKLNRKSRMKRIALVFLSMWFVGHSTLTAHAQAVTPIFIFTGINNLGANPTGSLTLGPDGNFYGTTYGTGGGGSGSGTVFEVNTAGTYSTLAVLSATGTNGTRPSGLTMADDGVFYGVASGGGSGYGTVFEVASNGALTTLFDFNRINGAYPTSLTLGADSNLYGTTSDGGNGQFASGVGTVFEITPGGTLTTLVNFNVGNGINGAYPNGLTLWSDGNLYGTTLNGGASNYGTLFMITTNSGFTILVNFTNSNGARPSGLTVGADGNLYGVTGSGGSDGYGTFFELSTNGFTTLTNFSAIVSNNITALTLAPDGNFYGPGSGGSAGSICELTADGTLKTLVYLTTSTGTSPSSLTLGPDGNFYGNAFLGNDQGGGGTVFQLELPPDFITAPSNQFASIGDTVAFSCQPFGSAPFGFQWMSNGVAIASATNSSIVLSNAVISTFSDTQFQVEVTDAWGAITSSPAIIVPYPGIFVQPGDQAVAIGSPALFSVSASGFPTFSYRWFFNGTLLPGATNPILRISPSLTNNIGNYQLVVSNIYGTVTSGVATLNVLLQPNNYAISKSSAGNPTVFLGSYPSSTNRLWASTNFPVWYPIATNVMDSNGLSQFLDTNTSAPQKFYRLSYP